MNWRSTIGKFLDITTEAITSHGGTVVKYLGDGTLAAFDSEHAAEAIDAAIRIQEMLSPRTGTTRSRSAWPRSASPPARSSSTRHLAGLDYVGSVVVDRASRLRDAGAPQAIWIECLVST
ncbi:hypothetical protein ACFC18_36195 [Streptomyces sp. NPDC056121]|uniref:hypothetical protein n=1 Tax=Streptomyces sp. NPDC056121 TaxID=3345718 RepID=UPI0035D667F8